MKRILLSMLAMLCITAIVTAQSLNEDFESYNVDDYISASSSDFITWSTNGAGTTEDAQVTDETAASGSKSIQIRSTAANGGPMDILVPFGAKHTSGLFNLSMQMNVATNAYGTSDRWK